MSGKVIVLKFGSSVLESRRDLPKVVHEVYRWVRQQYRVVAVISAFAGETDRLLETVAEYGDAQPETIARIVATGEEVATSFVALELDRFGIPSQVLDPSQIQLIADCESNDTEPVSVNAGCIEDVLHAGRVAVIPGFVARDYRGHVALFGRGGSDLSALFIARQLNARCRLIKDVDGIYDSDPAHNTRACRFAEITYAEALVTAGKVVQPKAIAFAGKTGVSFEVAALGATYATVVGAPVSSLEPKSAAPGRLRVGLLGLGTVGGGVFRELQEHSHLFEVTGVAVRTPERHSHDAVQSLLSRDCWDVIDDVDVVVELIGGTSPASDLVHAALEAGKPVVTANKLLLAENTHLGQHRGLRYSAAVGGAVPALEAVHAVAASEKIVALSGVVNGTCNYILDRIAAGCSFAEALGEAQANGFAEQDPRADISGTDSACKLKLLARQAFPGTHKFVAKVRGIEGIDSAWVRAVAAEGGRVRLVASAAWLDGAVQLEVRPQAVACEHAFAKIRNEENCLLIESLAHGRAGELHQHVWTGRGAGRWPTTAAVMADLFDIAREWRRQPQSERLNAAPYQPLPVVALTGGAA